MQGGMRLMTADRQNIFLHFLAAFLAGFFTLQVYPAIDQALSVHCLLFSHPTLHLVYSGSK